MKKERLKNNKRKPRQTKKSITEKYCKEIKKKGEKCRNNIKKRKLESVINEEVMTQKARNLKITMIKRAKEGREVAWKEKEKKANEKKN